MQELKEGQWQSVEAYETAKDEIISLNKARVTAVKDGIQKEIDAYQELIDKQKEALNAEKDAHDFQESVAEKQTEIAKLQRQLNALSGDSTFAAAAEKKKIQEELYEAQKELEELYYDHSIDTQQDALDKSLDAYEAARNAEMDALDESLTNEDQLFKDSFDLVIQNTDEVAKTLQDLVTQYGITASDAVVSPWRDGSTAIDDYKEKLGVASSSFVDELKDISSYLTKLQTEAEKTGQALVNSVNKTKTETEDAKPETPKTTPTTTPKTTPTAPSTAGMVSSISKTLSNGSSGDDVKKLQTALNALGYTSNDGKKLSVDGTFGTLTKQAVIKFQKANGLSQDGVVGPLTKEKFKAKGYATGTTGVPSSGFAWVDENQLEELVLHAGPDGRLQYLTKGTSVIPSDLTENLMVLGQLDPSEVLKRNTPSIGAPHIVNNNMSVTLEVGEVVHIDHADQNAIPDITAAVQQQLNKYFKSVNQSMRRYTR